MKKSKKSKMVLKYASGGRKGIWDTEQGCWRMKPTVDWESVRKKMDEIYEKLR